ncbi:MAG: T9SS type A sorting domain-containing protein [Armatimonadetes bacterium]|nr:T9SS type A sorting domain-containing protein [Armatimonadota bacterium]
MKQRQPMAVPFMVMALLTLGLLCPTTNHAQSVTMTSNVMGTGGGGVMTGGGLVAGITIGQPIIGITDDDAMRAHLGFWYTTPASLGVSGVREEHSSEVAGATARLLQNAPNPFSDRTQIALQLPTSGVISLRIYDDLGRQVMTPVEGFREAGTITVELQARDFESGRYRAQLTAGTTRQIITMIVVK